MLAEPKQKHTYMQMDLLYLHATIKDIFMHSVHWKHMFTLV